MSSILGRVNSFILASVAESVGTLVSPTMHWLTRCKSAERTSR